MLTCGSDLTASQHRLFGYTYKGLSWGVADFKESCPLQKSTPYYYFNTSFTVVPSTLRRTNTPLRVGCFTRAPPKV